MAYYNSYRRPQPRKLDLSELPEFDETEALEKMQDRVALIAAFKNDVLPVTPARDQEFAASLYRQFAETFALSAKQWHWVNELTQRVKGAEPIYGDFKAVRVMFMFAAENLKVPKIRLCTHWSDPDPEAPRQFIRLTFRDDEILIHSGGWAHHGERRFVGWVKNDRIVPYRTALMTDDIKSLIQDFSLDPKAVARAAAGIIGACSFCGQQLTDPVSKMVGYGPICAGHYHLPHGKEALKAAEAEKAEAAKKYRGGWKTEGLGG